MKEDRACFSDDCCPEVALLTLLERYRFMSKVKQRPTMDGKKLAPLLGECLG
ncbi:MAG: hypothetical protein ACUVRR_06145 [Candidatus Fervidibacter sp.]|uniref:hypothetical protein n=1 Tax=Candidatus Fervidibacter sp. TaxID=3100871 RepID=UPI00404A7147